MATANEIKSCEHLFDKNGNEYILYPVTKAENIIGLTEVLASAVDDAKKYTNETAKGLAAKSHASTTTDYGRATETNYGHAKASSTTPLANGNEKVGTDNGEYARGDHVHPTTTYGKYDNTNGYIELQVPVKSGENFIAIGITSSTSSTSTLSLTVNNATYGTVGAGALQASSGTFIVIMGFKSGSTIYLSQFSTYINNSGTRQFTTGSTSVSAPTDTTTIRLTYTSGAGNLKVIK